MKKHFKTLSCFMILALIGFSLASCATTDLPKATSLTVADNGQFKILQFTDTHIETDGTGMIKDSQTLKWMKEAVTKEKPDVAILTGDITQSVSFKRDTGILAIADMFEEMGQYWTYAFGNHDGEWSKVNGIETWVGRDYNLTKVKDVCKKIDYKTDSYAVKGDLVFGDNTRGNQEIFDLLKGYKYCLARQDASEKDPETRAAMGVGNYCVDLVNKEGEILYGLIQMDTHGKMYFNPRGNKNPNNFKDVGYVGLTDAQIAWYKKQAARYRQLGVKTGVFMHIPHYGFREATEEFSVNKKTGSHLSDYGVPQFKQKTDLKTFIVPFMFEETGFVKKEGIYSARWEDNLEAAIDQYKTTNLIAVGHDHNNCFTIKRDVGPKYDKDGTDKNEIILNYGRCSGVNAWGRRINIGATVINIDLNHQDTLENMYNFDVIYPSFEYEQTGGAHIDCKEAHPNKAGEVDC